MVSVTKVRKGKITTYDLPHGQYVAEMKRLGELLTQRARETYPGVSLFLDDNKEGLLHIRSKYGAPKVIIVWRKDVNKRPLPAELGRAVLGTIVMVAQRANDPLPIECIACDHAFRGDNDPPALALMFLPDFQIGGVPVCKTCAENCKRAVVDQTLAIARRAASANNGGVS
jgi:hypothetical protein